MSKIDKGEFQKRLDRLNEIFGDMVGRADELSQRRCPYRDRHDHCTAKFRCRNQESSGGKNDPIFCRHDGRFDYRDAWESDPATYDRAKRKLDRIKEDAVQRRAKRRSGKAPE